MAVGRLLPREMNLQPQTGTSVPVSVRLTSPYRTWRSVTRDGFTLYLTGHVFRDLTLLEPLDLLTHLLPQPDLAAQGAVLPDAFRERLATLNGFFALVLQAPGWTLAAVDRVRSIPLFYRLQPEPVELYDQLTPDHCLKSPEDLDAGALTDFLYAGYCTGAATLSRHYHQLEAGHFFYLPYTRPLRPIVQAYFRFLPSSTPEAMPFSEFAERFVAALDHAFERLRVVAADRPLVVPLSGGLDSRLVAAMLRRKRFANVLCFTYGNPTTSEVQTSKAVADILRYPWRFAPYDSNSWHRWITSERCAAYWKYSSNLSSLPCFQDLPALESLLANKQVPQGGTLLPGHSGDFLAGSHIPLSLYRNPSADNSIVATLLLRNHFNLWPLEQPQATYLKHRVLSHLAALTANCPHLPAYALYEACDFQERQAKYIVNSTRAYEFAACSWWLPLWDSEVISVLLPLPLEARFCQRYYISALREHIFPQAAPQLSQLQYKHFASRQNALRRLHELGRAILSQLSLLEPARALYRAVIPSDSLHPLGFHTWFAKGANPRRTQLLDTLALPRSAPDPVLQLLGRFARSRLSALNCLGILSIHVSLFLLENMLKAIGPPTGQKTATFW